MAHQGEIHGEEGRHLILLDFSHFKSHLHESNIPISPSLKNPLIL